MTFLLDHDVPDDVSYSLVSAGHSVIFLRNVLPPSSTDQDVFDYAQSKSHVLISCNRDDFLNLASSATDHAGLVILVRRRTRAAERSALIKLIDDAGDRGISGNVNFA